MQERIGRTRQRSDLVEPVRDEIPGRGDRAEQPGAGKALRQRHRDVHGNPRPVDCRRHRPQPVQRDLSVGGPEGVESAGQSRNLSGDVHARRGDPLSDVRDGQQRPRSPPEVRHQSVDPEQEVSALVRRRFEVGSGRSKVPAGRGEVPVQEGRLGPPQQDSPVVEVSAQGQSWGDGKHPHQEEPSGRDHGQPDCPPPAATPSGVLARRCRGPRWRSPIEQPGLGHG